MDLFIFEEVILRKGVAAIRRRNKRASNGARGISNEIQCHQRKNCIEKKQRRYKDQGWVRHLLPSSLPWAYCEMAMERVFGLGATDRRCQVEGRLEQGRIQEGESWADWRVARWKRSAIATAAASPMTPAWRLDRTAWGPSALCIPPYMVLHYMFGLVENKGRERRQGRCRREKKTIGSYRKGAAIGVTKHR